MPRAPRPPEKPPGRRNLLEYFYAVERESPGFTAIIETVSAPDGPRSVRARTLAELRLLADSMTGALQGQGIAPGERIALLMPRGVMLTAAMLAAQQCGAVFTRLPLSLAQDRAADILYVSGAVLVCCTPTPSSIRPPTAGVCSTSTRHLCCGPTKPMRSGVGSGVSRIRTRTCACFSPPAPKQAQGCSSDPRQLDQPPGRRLARFPVWR
jgi:hypothetical protein